MRHSTFFSGVTTYVGTVVGAGIFALPYVVSTMGYWYGLCALLGVSVLMYYTTRAYGVVILSTTGIHQFAGYARKHLGRVGWFISIVVTVFGLYGALLAYLVEMGHMTGLLMPDAMIVSDTFSATIWWAVLTGVLLFGVGVVAKMERFFVAVLMALFVLFVVYTIRYSHIDSLPYHATGSELFSFFGILLFATVGFTALPEIRHFFSRHREAQLLQRAVLQGTVIVTLFYIAFSFGVVLLSGAHTTPSAVEGLGTLLGPWIQTSGAIFGLIAIGTSYVVVGLALIHLFQYDVRTPHVLAFLLVTSIPLVLLYTFDYTFIHLLSIAGAWSVGIQGFIIWSMYRQVQLNAKEYSSERFIPYPLQKCLQFVFLLPLLYSFI